MTNSRRGRPPTGCPDWDPDAKQWVAYVRLPTGQRRPVPMPGIAEEETERAAKLAKTLALRAREGGFVPEEATETCSEYFGRWTEARELQGIRTTADERGRWRKWVEPHLGVKPVATLETRDLELVLTALDLDVRAGKLGWKTAILAWGVVTKTFDDAVRSKTLDLRARKGNPARDVRGPDRGVDKASAFLFPSELATLLSCATVPLARRRFYALAVYLGTRPGELRALDWSDVHPEGPRLRRRPLRRALRAPPRIALELREIRR